jgi:hypothetical protein
METYNTPELDNFRDRLQWLIDELKKVDTDWWGRPEVTAMNLIKRLQKENTDAKQSNAAPKSDFKSELRSIINRCSMENWYGVELKPGCSATNNAPKAGDPVAPTPSGFDYRV